MASTSQCCGFSPLWTAAHLPASPCECPLPTTSCRCQIFSSLSILRFGSVPFQLLRGTGWLRTARSASRRQLVVGTRMRSSCGRGCSTQLVTVRVPSRSCKHVHFIAVGHQRVMNVLKHVSAIHVLHIILTSCPCLSSLARAFLPESCHTSSLSGVRRTRTVQLLSGLILARCLTSPQSHQGRIANKNAIQSSVRAGRQLALLDCLHVLHGLDTINSKRVRCRIHSDDVLYATIWLASRRLSAFCCHQHVATSVSVTTRIIAPTWLLPSPQAWFCNGMHAQSDTD